MAEAIVPRQNVGGRLCIREYVLFNIRCNDRVPFLLGWVLEEAVCEKNWRLQRLDNIGTQKIGTVLESGQDWSTIILLLMLEVLWKKREVEN